MLVEQPPALVKGFKALGKAVGIKNGKKDLGVVYSPVVCTAAGVFTTNKMKAAPLLVSEKHLLDGKAQALVVNSGVANACTGEEGMRNAEKTAELAASELGIAKENVLVLSTGVIGKQLPMDVIEKGIKGVKEELGETRSHVENFAEAVMTTDTKKKMVFVERASGGFSMTGVAKGSGMIEPNMATMLAFIFTDAKLEPDFAKAALKNAVDASFNCISVDGCQSTNDSVVLMANGLAGEPVDAAEFEDALKEACVELAKMIVKDGEGATKFVEVEVVGAEKSEDAKKIAKAIVNSSLVKASLFGGGANAGRIAAAIGAACSQIDPAKVSVSVCGEQVIKNGVACGFDGEKIKALTASGGEIKILVQLDAGIGADSSVGAGNAGGASAKAFGCDLSFDYVKINSRYKT